MMARFNDVLERSVFEYPGMFASSSVELAKFKLLDHIFNTCGNGINPSFFEQKPLDAEQKKNAQQLLNCPLASYGYTHVKYIGETMRPDRNFPHIVVNANDKHLHPDIKLWVDFSCTEERVPYPNFSKDFSFVWRYSFEFDEEWKKEIIWYYQKCLDFFNDKEKSKKYHGAFPHENQKDNEISIQFMTKKLKSCSPEQIEAEIGFPFVGSSENEADVCEFLQQIWDKNKKKIEMFIHETIQKLSYQ